MNDELYFQRMNRIRYARKFQLGGIAATVNSPTNVFPLANTAPVGSSFASFMGNNAGVIGGAVSALNGLSDAIFGQKRGLDGPNGGLTQTIDTAYDQASDMVMKFNPLIGGIMKGAGFLGNTLNKVGGGTDGMTKADAVLNSAPMTLMTLGLNGFLGDTTESIKKNEEAFAQVGSSYGGTGSVVDDAISKAGKKYGMVSGGARTEANRLIRKAQMQQDIMANIGDKAQDTFAIQSSMSAINGNRRAFAMQGGYDQSAIRVGKQGLKLQKLEETARKVQEYRSKLLDERRVQDPFDIFVSTLPDYQKPLDDGGFNVRRYWELNGKPKDFDEAVSKGMYTLEEDGWHAHTVQYNEDTDEYEFMKAPNHPTIHFEEDWYNSDDGAEFRSQYELQKTEPYWKYVRRKSSPTKHKQGGSINITPSEIFLVNEMEEFKDGGIIEHQVSHIELVCETPEFQEGGSINVIPDGALHARKHNMDMEGITTKGIPVISEEQGGEIQQQAEIEKEEIIFRLEVTKKLEELQKKYKSDEYTQKEKDEFAIEAGKLLVNEILYNTVDNTNNLL